MVKEFLKIMKKSLFFGNFNFFHFFFNFLSGKVRPGSLFIFSENNQMPIEFYALILVGVIQDYWGSGATTILYS